jgi:hypothetical protein
VCPDLMGSGRFFHSLVWFQVSLVSFDLRLSSLAMVVALVRWSFGAIARRLPACLLRQALPDSGDGGARTAACLQLVLEFVVVSRWSKDLSVFFITFGAVCTATDDY